VRERILPKLVIHIVLLMKYMKTFNYRKLEAFPRMGAMAPGTRALGRFVDDASFKQTRHVQHPASLHRAGRRSRRGSVAGGRGA